MENSTPDTRNTHQPPHQESDDRPRFEILFPPPTAPEKPDVADAGTQAPSIGACPRHMWEPGAPTPADVAAMGDRDRELTVILRMTLPETHVQHSTIVKIADTKTVQELLGIVCERLRRKVGVSMDARTLALTVTDGDQRATLEWSDPEKEVYLFPEDADAAMPPTLAGSPRKDAAAFAEEHRRTKSYVAEHPCSDRPLRTLAYVHENYPPDFLVLEDLQARVWFTVKPAAHPLYPKETEARTENIAFSTMVNVKIASSKLLKSLGRTPTLTANDLAPLTMSTSSSRRSRGGSAAAASAREGSQHSSPRDDEGLDGGASSSSRPERLPQTQSSLLGASHRDDARSLSSAGTSGSESDGHGGRRRRRGSGGGGRGGSAGSTLTVPIPAAGGRSSAARRGTGSPPVSLRRGGGGGSSGGGGCEDGGSADERGQQKRRQSSSNPLFPQSPRPQRKKGGSTAASRLSPLIRGASPISPAPSGSRGRTSPTHTKRKASMGVGAPGAAGRRQSHAY